MSKRRDVGVWSMQDVDGGVLGFDREAGRYTLLRGPSWDGNVRKAPRLLQIGLLTPCNLKCSFCYRDLDAPSRLSRRFLVPLLQDAARWGVLEVAFGGGEPLIFPELVEMLRELRETTALGLNMTSNGVLLTPSLIDELGELLGELRISAYPDNHYRRTLLRTRSMQTGLNLMVTPQNVDRVEALVHDALCCGANNVLLLGYKGEDASLHLGPHDCDVLRGAIVRMEGLPIRLGICLYPKFEDVPHVFERGDCDAGDDFLTITPDRAVQACSFSTERVPFETCEDLRAIYEAMRAERSVAQVRGCTRSEFSQVARVAPERNTAWSWEVRGANNSADFTAIGQFCDVRVAEQVASVLRVFFEDIQQDLLAWNAEHEPGSRTFWRASNSGVLFPSAEAMIERYGLDVGGYEHGVKDNHEVPEVRVVGVQVVIYHRYCLGLDVDFLHAIFTHFEGQYMSPERDGEPSFLIEICATGSHPDVELALEDFFTSPEYFALDFPEVPEAVARAVADGGGGGLRAIRAARWSQDHWVLDVKDGVLICVFEVEGDAGYGALLLEWWLELCGYEDIFVTARYNVGS